MNRLLVLGLARVYYDGVLPQFLRLGQFVGMHEPIVSRRRSQPDSARPDNDQPAGELIDYVALAKQLLYEQENCGATRVDRRIDDRDPTVLLGRVIQNVAEVLILREKDHLVRLGVSSDLLIRR